MNKCTIPLCEREISINKVSNENFFWIWVTDPFWIRKLKKCPFLYDMKITYGFNGSNPLLEGKIHVQGITFRRTDRYKKLEDKNNGTTKN